MKRKKFSQIIASGVIDLVKAGLENEESDEMITHIVTNHIDYHLGLIDIDEITIETFLKNL